MLERNTIPWPVVSRSVAIVLFSFILSAVSVPAPGQDYGEVNRAVDGDIQVEFLRQDTEMDKASSYFNAVRLANRSANNFRGVLQITIPRGWNLIGPRVYEIGLAPGEETVIPVRVSMPPSTLGGISYLISAEVSADDFYTYASAYVSIRKISSWDLSTGSSKIFLSTFHPEGALDVKLKNRGNGNELIKLAFQTGSLLEFADPVRGDSLMFIELPAFSDTLMTFRVRERAELTYAQRRAALKSFRSSSINLVASTPGERRYAGFRVYSLESEHDEGRMVRQSPLNFSLTLNNLLSSRTPKVSFRTHGKILFPETQQIAYSVGFNNLYFSSERNSNLDLYQFLRYSLQYTDERSNVIIGDRVGVGELHILTGQGLRARHTFSDIHTVYLNAVQNPLAGNIGAFMGYGINIKGVNLNTGATVESKTREPGGHYSLHMGTHFRFLRYNSIRAQFISTINNFPSGPYLSQDTTLIGFAYRLSYQYNDGRLRINADQYNTKLNYLRNSGINRINLRANYRINNVSSLDGLYYRSAYAAKRYPYSFYNPANENTNDNVRLLYNHTLGGNVYRAGPQYLSSTRLHVDSRQGYTSIFRNREPGVFGSITFKLAGLQTLTPTLQLSTLFIDYSSENPDMIPYARRGLFNYRLGFNYYDQAFKFNASFSSGEVNDLYRSVLIEDDPRLNQVITLRPYYERYLKDETIRLSAYLNFIYYMPSSRENTVFNITSDFFLKNGWHTYLSFFYYRNVRSDEEAVRFATSDINLLVGIRKALDIQQPRLKYYDLTIVGFNDADGDGVKGANEKPISNVLINIARNEDLNEHKRTGFSEIGLITDPNGEIFYRDIPEGVYDLSITPLTNLGTLYLLNGENQRIEIRDDEIIYLAMVESYKIAGRVIVDRDPNSNEGSISMEGIRVTAVSEKGETYSTLTNGEGMFMLSLPRATRYEVSIFNVFGEQFILERGRYVVQFMENRTINLDFRFREKRRQIRFEGDQLFEFNLQRDEMDQD